MGRLAGVLRALGASWGVLGPLGASWGRPGRVVGHLGSVSRAIPIKTLIFIDFCSQLRPPKPSKSSPRRRESSILKKPIFEINIDIFAILVPTCFHFAFILNLLGASGGILRRLGCVLGPPPT